MESQPHRGLHFAHRQPSLLSLLCLVVFLPYLLLPAVYYSHLTAAFLPAFQGVPRAGPLAIGTYPEKPQEPYHDSNTCPICRGGTSSFQDYGFCSLPQAPEGATPAWLAAVISPTPIIATSDFLVSEPRAPPVFL
ncbi:MAG: hypothetical protein NTY36_14630 [Deltaproteobacteria bacterium]|nr:hypothetical protein [Deltaproteobacteria bacterium]